MEAGLTTGEEAEPPPPQARLTARLLPLWRDRLRRSEPTAPRIPTTPKQLAREVLGPPGQENLLRGRVRSITLGQRPQSGLPRKLCHDRSVPRGADVGTQ